MKRRTFIKKGLATVAVAGLANSLLASKHKMLNYSYSFSGTTILDGDNYSLILYLNSSEIKNFSKEKGYTITLELNKVSQQDYIKVLYKIDKVVKDNSKSHTYHVNASFASGTTHKIGENASKQLSNKSLIPSFFREKISFSMLHDSIDYYIRLNTSTNEALTMYDHASMDDCFLTSACVRAKNLPDNCYELQTLRNFRDDYMKNSDEGNLLIEQYYEVAPNIVKKINTLHNQKEVYNYMYETLVIPSLKYIQAGEKKVALEYYQEYTMALNKLFSE